MAASKHPRSKFLIDQSVQGAITWRIIVHWSSFIVAGFCFGFVFQMLANPFTDLGQQFSIFWWNQVGFIFVLLFMTPVIICDTIKLSNRFAGPVYRLRDTIRRINAGENPPPVHFREDDFWREMADEFNAMTLQLRALNDDDAKSPADNDEAVAATVVDQEKSAANA